MFWPQYFIQYAIDLMDIFTHNYFLHYIGYKISITIHIILNNLYLYFIASFQSYMTSSMHSTQYTTKKS